jgi:hypothetical protein
MWEPQPLATLRAFTACTGIILPLLNEAVSIKTTQREMINERGAVCGTQFLGMSTTNPK